MRKWRASTSRQVSSRMELLHRAEDLKHGAIVFGRRLRVVCTTFPDPRKGPGRQYRGRRFRCVGICDVLHAERMSASFLAYHRTMEKGHGRSNWHRPDSLLQLYPRHAGRGGSRAPAALFRTHGGVAERAANAGSFRPGGRILIAVDGTEFFCSQKLSCPHCRRASAPTARPRAVIPRCRRRS
jgi:hypothetical protein